jgi:osmotically inducible lipoprotein OsmB
LILIRNFGMRKSEGETEMKKTIIFILVALLFFAGCAGMSATEQRVLSGGAIGAGGGALIGAAAGSAAIGAAIGGGAGLLGGYAYDQYQKSHEVPKSREASMLKKPRPSKRSKQGPTKGRQEKVTPQEASAPPPHVM